MFSNKTYLQPYSIARLSLAVLFLFPVVCSGQLPVNLVLNGAMSDYSFSKPADSLMSDTGAIHIAKWERNRCQFRYDKTFKPESGAFILVEYFHQLSHKDIYTAHAVAELCRLLDSAGQYRISFTLQPYAANYSIPDIAFAFDSAAPDVNLYLKLNAKNKVVNKPVRNTYSMAMPGFEKDSVYHFSYLYTANGHERFLSIGNLTGNIPQKRRLIKPFGVVKAAFDYSRWCKLALTNVSVTPVDMHERACPVSVTNADKPSTRYLNK